VAFTLIDYLFKSVVKAEIAPERLPSFFATVNVVLNVLSLLAQLALVPWIMRSAGVTRAIFVVPVARVASVEELPGETVALDARRGAPLTGPAATDTTIVVGAERAGLSPEVLAACDRAAHIPIANESLNAAMAATLALYELSRVIDPETAQ